MTRAWTLGYPPAYDKAIRMPGNAKAPGGYAFRTRDLAVLYSVGHFLGYEPYEIVLPRPFARATTRDFMTAARARHRWHQAEMPYMPECGVCKPPRMGLEKCNCDLLVVQAPLINPDTGQPA